MASPEKPTEEKKKGYTWIGKLCREEEKNN